jgi:sugar lactone lactonase YvrE
VDASGNLFIADTYNNRVRKVSASGIITTVAGSGIPLTAGNVGFSGDGGPAISARLNSPYGVAVDASGNLFIADTYNNRIRKVSTTGMITTVAGSGGFGGYNSGGYAGDGGPAASALLNQPYGVAVDTSGNLFIADNLNCRIRKVSASGMISTVAGGLTYGFSGDGGPAASALLSGHPQLSNPQGIGQRHHRDRRGHWRRWFRRRRLLR